MEKDFDYSTVPSAYIYCFNEQCPHSTKCLHYLVALHADPKRAILSTLNPAYIAGKEKDCLFFQPDRLLRFASGITHLLDKIPHEKAVKIQKDLYSMLRNIYNKDRLIHPEEQKAIRQLFLLNGIKEEPVFDEYLELYNWQE